MKGCQRHYTPEELAWIEAFSDCPRRQLHAAFCASFGRTDVSFDNFKALCTRKSWKTGRTGTFPKGNVSWNKGRTMPFNENSARMRFKKGQLPYNTKYLGHERRYAMKHKHLWEQRNGPVPEGMFLKCLDGNRQNTDPANWELLPRATQTYLGGFRGIDYEAAEPAIRPAIIAIAKLRHAARTVKVKVKVKGGAA